MASFRKWGIKLPIIAAAIAGAAVLSGCVSPDPRPFQQYAAAVGAAGNGLDLALTTGTDWSRDKYVTSVLDGSVSLGNTALLDHHGKFTVLFPTNNGAVEPTFYKLQDIRLTLLAMNSAIGQYVETLAELAGTDLVNPETFKAMAEKTDASLNSIAKQLDARVSGSAIHVFSVAGTEIMKLIIENHRRRALEKVLINNQTPMEAYCGKCVRLLEILDQSLATDYDTKSRAIEEAFSAIKPDKRASDTEAKKHVEDLLDLNAEYLDLVNSMRGARNVFEQLPRGHRDLLEAVQKKPTELAAVKALYEEGMRLKQLYDQLNKPSATH